MKVTSLNGLGKVHNDVNFYVVNWTFVHFIIETTLFYLGRLDENTSKTGHI